MTRSKQLLMGKILSVSVILSLIQFIRAVGGGKLPYCRANSMMFLSVYLLKKMHL